MALYGNAKVHGDARIVGDPEPDTVVLSRHDGAIEWIVRHWADWAPEQVAVYGDLLCTLPGRPVARVIRGNATPDDVRGRRVIGAVPFCLASLAREVVAIEFDAPPRGAELSCEDMELAGAALRRYRVQAIG